MRFIVLLMMIIGLSGMSTLLAQECLYGDCKNGFGVAHYLAEGRYVGFFQGGQRHGLGKIIYSHGGKYIGEWIDDQQEGRGESWYKEEMHFEGIWREGQFQIRQVVQLEHLPGYSRIVRSQCLVGDCEDGKGQFLFSNGSLYAGQFSGGRMGGHGMIYYADGGKHRGKFQKGLAEGMGTYTFPDGRQLTGCWRDGVLKDADCGQAPTIRGEGDSNPDLVIAGCVSGDCENGFGEYLSRDGSIYKGTFKNGLRHGFGTVQYPGGTSFNGKWLRGMRQGSVLSDRRSESEHSPVGIPKSAEGSNAGPATLARIGESGANTPIFSGRPRTWAVIIGVADYVNMWPLTYPNDDAWSLYAYLQSPRGGALPEEQVRLLVDDEATRANILKAMEDVFGRAGPEDLILLYFSGHGLRGSFLPFDYDGGSNQVWHTDINYILSRSKARYKLCIADACHSGSLLGSDGQASGQFFEQLATPKAGLSLILSSKASEKSLESKDLRRGVFTHFLLKGMKGAADSNLDKLVTLQELYDYIYQNVRHYTGHRQSPVIRGDFHKGLVISGAD